MTLGSANLIVRACVIAAVTCALVCCQVETGEAQTWDSNASWGDYYYFQDEGTESPAQATDEDLTLLDETPQSDDDDQQQPWTSSPEEEEDADDWADQVRVGYDSGFTIASKKELDLDAGDLPFRLTITGWGQLRHTVFESEGPNRNVNQFQLKRGRVVFSGHAFVPEFSYFIQIDGRSSSGDDVRLLDYFLRWDIGHRSLGLDKGVLRFRTGRYKMPFTMSRDLSGREFEFADRSVASIFFDVNRSLGWGLEGKFYALRRPWYWEAAVFNGLVTGGAETGSSGSLDNNFAGSARIHAFPCGEWGRGSLADFDGHCTLATRIGAGFATSKIDRAGRTEFDSLRVNDSGERLSGLLPPGVFDYNVFLYSVDASFKYYGWSGTLEYYFRSVTDFRSPLAADLFDHGFWLQGGKFVVPERLQLLARWSRVMGNSGNLGLADETFDELAGGFAWYFREQHAKLVVDATYLNGAPVNSSALDINPGDVGWLYRTQIQFSF